MSQEQVGGFDLLDNDIDDFEDLPEFATPWPGNYKFIVKGEPKKVNDKDSVTLTFELLETIEVEDKFKEMEPYKPGTKFSILYQLDNEFARGNLKKDLMPFCNHFGTRRPSELLNGPLKEGVTITATCKRRKNKEDEDKPYAVVSNIVIE